MRRKMREERRKVEKGKKERTRVPFADVYARLGFTLPRFTKGAIHRTPMNEHGRTRAMPTLYAGNATGRSGCRTKTRRKRAPLSSPPGLLREMFRTERKRERGRGEREKEKGRLGVKRCAHVHTPIRPSRSSYYHSTWMEAIDPGNRWICYVRARERSVILFSPFRFSGRRDRSNSSRARAARNTPGEKMPGEEEEEEEEVNEVLIYSSVGPSGPSFLSLGRDGWKHDRHLARGKAFPLYPG